MTTTTQTPPPNSYLVYLEKHKHGDTTVNDLADLIAALAPSFGTPGLSTRRAIDADEVTAAWKAIDSGEATQRVRVYSEMGFVARSYRSATIQWVEANLTNGVWVWTVGSGSAGRPYGHGNLKVVN